MFIIMSTVKHYLVCLLKCFVNFPRIPAQTQSLYGTKTRTRIADSLFVFTTAKKKNKKTKQKN